MKVSLKIEPKNIITLLVNKELTSKFINKETEIIINNLARVKINFSNIKKTKNLIKQSLFLKIFHLIFYIALKIYLLKILVEICLY